MADRENASAPEPLSLVRDMWADAAWLDGVKSLDIEVESTWTTSPEEIARRLAEHKAERPDIEWTPERFPDLRPTFVERTHLAFDERRIFHRQERPAIGGFDVTLWDGTRAIRSARNAQYQSLQLDTKLCPLLEYVLSDVPWLQKSGHQFWFLTDEQRLSGSFSDRAGHYDLLGRTPFRGVDCYAINSHLLRTSWWIGVQDHRLHGTRSYIVPPSSQEQFMEIWQEFARKEGWTFSFLEWEEWIRKQPEEVQDRVFGRFSRAVAPVTAPHIEEWFEDYADLGDGRYAPMKMGYTIFDRDAPGRMQCSRDIRVLRLEVDQPLADSLFQMQLQDGANVTDLSYDPPLHYRQKADRTAEEWQEIRGEADVRRAKAQAAQRERDLLMGKMAPELPAGEWLGSDRLTWADLKGKAVVLDFFSECSWNEFSTLSMIKVSSPQSGIVVIAVPVGFRSVETVRRMVKEHRLDCPVCLVQGRAGSELLDRYHMDRIPYAFVVDPDGRVAGHGALRQAILRAIALAVKDKAPNR